MLLTSIGSCDMVAATKVSDFGTAKEDVRGRVNSQLPTQATGNMKSHASTKMVIGTVPYMPPEYHNKGHVSEKLEPETSGIDVTLLGAHNHIRGIQTSNGIMPN